MSQMLCFYLAVYLTLAISGGLWLRFIWRMHSDSWLLNSWLGSWLLIGLVSIGFFLGALLTTVQWQQFAAGILLLLLFSMMVRRLSPAQYQLWSKLPPPSQPLRGPVMFFSIWLILDGLLKQFNHPPYGWDELAVWIPKMQVIAAGRFSEIYQMGIPAYPPLWPIIGSLALTVDSMMLYLLPVFLLGHTLLVLTEWIARRSSGNMALLAWLFLLPSVWRLAQEIQTFTLYANLPVAICLVVVYLLTEEEPLVRRIWLAIIAAMLVLLRTETILIVFLLSAVDSFRWLRRWWLLPAIWLYAVWWLVRQREGIVDPISNFVWLGWRELIAQPLLVISKAGQIAVFAAKRLWWSEVYWFLPVYAGLVWWRQHWSRWTWFVLLVSSYVFGQYLLVPLDVGVGLDWWLGTGWVRLLSSVMLIVLPELALLLGESWPQVIMTGKARPSETI